MITTAGLTKRYGATTAVDDLTVEVRPDRVTGFLGPNGAGKSTTLRLVLGLDRPSAGTAAIDGRPYRALRRPLHQVGALLDATAVPAGLTGRAYLRAIARSNRIGRARVAEVLDLVGLAPAAGKRIGGYSLGMKQRLGIAVALLGDPPVLIFDEPANGLDPEGIRWIRTLFKNFAAQGRTVLVSSHVMSEMQNTADHLIVIGRGRLIADMSIAEFVERGAAGPVLARTPDVADLAKAVAAAGGRVRTVDHDRLEITGLSAAQVSDLALERRIAVHELTQRSATLEEAFLDVTAPSLDYGSSERTQA